MLARNSAQTTWFWRATAHKLVCVLARNRALRQQVLARNHALPPPTHTTLLPFDASTQSHTYGILLFASANNPSIRLMWNTSSYCSVSFFFADNRRTILWFLSFHLLSSGSMPATITTTVMCFHHHHASAAVPCCAPHVALFSATFSLVTRGTRSFW